MADTDVFAHVQKIDNGYTGTDGAVNRKGKKSFTYLVNKDIVMLHMLFSATLSIINI